MAIDWPTSPSDNDTHTVGARVFRYDAAINAWRLDAVLQLVEIGIALGDNSTPLEAGAALETIRLPFAMHLTEVRASLTDASSSGAVTFDINEAGTTILSTKLTVDEGETTSTTAATPAVISDADLAEDAEITFDCDGAGTGATGAKVWLIGTRA